MTIEDQAVLAEREACLKICREYMRAWQHASQMTHSEIAPALAMAARELASRIEARGASTERKVATLIKSSVDLDGADQRLYRCSPPYQGHRCEECNGFRACEHVIVSAYVADGQRGAYVYEANSSGRILAYRELNGSQVDTLDHEKVLRDMGYETEVVT